MTYSRFIPFTLALISIALWYIGYVCIDHQCLAYPLFHPIIASVLAPIGIYSVCLLLPSLLALFISARVFSKWLRFALWWTLVSFVLIVLTPSSAHGFFQTVLWSKGATALVTGMLLALISFMLFTVHFFKRALKKRVKKN